jgi:hypothetical protein
MNPFLRTLITGLLLAVCTAPLAAAEPAGQCEIACAIGARQGGTYSLSISLPNRQPQVFADLLLPADFQRVDWIGFSSFGKPGTVFYLDDLKIWCEDR